MNTGTMTLDQIRIEGLKALERHTAYIDENRVGSHG